MQITGELHWWMGQHCKLGCWSCDQFNSHGRNLVSRWRSLPEDSLRLPWKTWLQIFNGQAYRGWMVKHLCIISYAVVKRIVSVIVVLFYNSQKDFVCFDFVPRHHNIIRFRKGLAMIREDFSTVCSWVQFPNKEEWKYDLMLGNVNFKIKRKLTLNSPLLIYCFTISSLLPRNNALQVESGIWIKFYST